MTKPPRIDYDDVLLDPDVDGIIWDSSKIRKILERCGCTRKAKLVDGRIVDCACFVTTHQQPIFSQWVDDLKCLGPGKIVQLKGTCSAEQVIHYLRLN